MKIQEILDWILRITGMLAILKIIIRILFNKNKWYDNVKITRISNSKQREYEYNYVTSFGDFLDSVTIIEGNAFPIRKVSVYECIFYKNDFRKGKLLFSHKTLLPGEAVFLNLDYGCAMPRYMIEITNYNYEKAEILLAENGFNGNVNHENGIVYKNTFLSRIYNLIFN